jgi:hypothetical protein
MLIFWNQKTEYRELIQFYELLAAHLISPTIVEDYRKLGSVNYLKTKAILYHYYHRDLPGLAEEVANAFKKDPSSPVLQRLDELVRSRTHR